MTDEGKRKVLAVLDYLMEGTSGLVRATIMACKCAVDEMEVEEKWIPVADKQATNADRIRDMSDEELEDVIRAISLGYEPWCDHHCKMQGEDNCNICLKKWLQQPVE